MIDIWSKYETERNEAEKRLMKLAAVGALANMLFWGSLIVSAYLFARYQGWVR